MKLNMTWAEAARAAGGRLKSGPAESPFDSFSTDTRALRPGEAFWALKGPRYDAHAFLNKEPARGCSGWIADENKLPNSEPSPTHVISVPDTLRALQALAAYHRKRFDIPIVAVTGSNGKTTTKEMLKSILDRLGPACASPGNWNNHIGLPLSLLNLEAAHRWGIFELADSHPGDIDEIAKIARPTLAVLTNIAPDHLEFYGTMESNFKTKLELLSHIPQDAPVVFNGDDEWLSSLAGHLGSRAVSFGSSSGCRVRFSGDEIIVDRHKIAVRLAALGTLSRYNAAACAAAAWSLGVDLETIRLGLEAYRPSAMRMEVRLGPSGAEILLDAYNANPASMKAALQAFFEAYPSRKKLLALGDMKELGERSESFHAELGEWLSELPASAAYLAGPCMEAAAAALKRKKAPFPFFHGKTHDAWIEELRREADKDSAVFIKASRAMRFEDVFAALCSTS